MVLCVQGPRGEPGEKGEKGVLGRKGPQVRKEKATASGLDLGFKGDALVVLSLKVNHTQPAH